MITARRREHPVRLEAGRSRRSPGAGCPGEEPGSPDWSRQSWASAGATVSLSHVGLEPLRQVVCVSDAQPLRCSGVVRAMPCVAHLDATFRWAGDASASLGMGTAHRQGVAFLFPAETGRENTSHGNVVPGRKMLTGSRWLSQLRLCPLSPCPAVPQPSGCHRVGKVRCSVTGGDRAARVPPHWSCRAGDSPGAECRLARSRVCNPLRGAPAQPQALAVVNPHSCREWGRFSVLTAGWDGWKAVGVVGELCYTRQGGFRE